jgi:hypothetical protein
MPNTRPDDHPVELPEPPQPLPLGAEGSDDVGGELPHEKPHKTCSDGAPKGARRIKDEVA